MPYIEPPEDVCTTLRTPARRAASARRTVPTTLTVESNCGSSTERVTEIWAAKWKTTSGFASASSPIRSASTMSALAKSHYVARPARPRWQAGPAVAGVPVRRSRRACHAGGVPGGGWHHPARALELDRASDQPGGAAAVGVAGAVARTARHSRLAAGAAVAVDVRL